MDLENLRQQNRAKSIGTIFNSTITSLPSCLVLPPIPIGVTFQIPHGLIANLPKFSGTSSENAIMHVKSVLELCMTQNEQNVGLDTFRLRVFPLTLIDGTKMYQDLKR